jgi:alkylation response protein AidB-like acyl-CoA dehydrogenase
MDSRSEAWRPKWACVASRRAICIFTIAGSHPRTGSVPKAAASAWRWRRLTVSRPGIAAQAVGLAQGATDYALRYATQRVTFGRPIADHQLVAATLAEMEVKCAAARSLLYGCGRMLDAGVSGPTLTKMASMTKLVCSDVVMEVTPAAVQVLGGYGYLRDHPVERTMRRR